MKNTRSFNREKILRDARKRDKDAWRPLPKAELDTLIHMARSADGRLYRCKGARFTTGMAGLLFHERKPVGWFVGSYTVGKLERKGLIRRCDREEDLPWFDPLTLTKEGVVELLRSGKDPISPGKGFKAVLLDTCCATFSRHNPQAALHYEPIVVCTRARKHACNHKDPVADMEWPAEVQP